MVVTSLWLSFFSNHHKNHKFAMKFTFVTLATAALVAADIQIQVLTSDTGLQLGFVNAKTGPGASNAFAYVDSAATLLLYANNLAYYVPSASVGPFPMVSVLVSTKGFLIVAFARTATTPLNFQPLTTTTSYIANAQYWACTNFAELGGLSSSFPLIVSTAFSASAPASTCRKVNLVVNNNQLSSSSSSSTAKPVTTTWSNGTVTSYTTYCPLPTVITITSCDTVCYPTAVTVSTATTITCNNCLAPTTKTVTAVSTLATSTSPAKPSTVASTSTVKSISVVNAGVKNAVGAMGIAGIAAMLL